MDKTKHLKEMIKFMAKPKHKKIYRERAFRLELMQGLVKIIFDLNRCWIRGDENKRWLFLAMGLIIQMHQFEAYERGKWTWNIKEPVLG